MSSAKGVRSPITRSGARRLGDEYQDLVALEVLVDWLEHSERYEWVQVEADGAGALDDVVARQKNGSTIYRQSKFSVHPDRADDPWTWEKLLKQEAGTQGMQLPSLLQDWAASLRRVSVSGQPVEAALYSNRDAADEIRQAFAQGDRTLLDLAKLPSQTRAEITSQLGGEESARFFFQCFHFRVNEPDLAVLEESLWWRFSRLGGTHYGWLSLKEHLRFWVCHRNEPPPDGFIRLVDVRRAARWHELEGLAQEYTIPDDYVPPRTFLQGFAQKLVQSRTGCIVLSGSPGIGKSTFISHLYERFQAKRLPAVRHHYFLGTNHPTSGFRLDHLRAAESLMHDLARDHSQALGPLRNENPQPADLRKWLAACGEYYAKAGKALTVLVDGLDHVWRERRSLLELTRLLESLLPPPEGVVLVFASQPVDDDHLPPILLRHAPRDSWLELPQLDQPAVEQWVRKHALDFPSQAEQMQSAVFIGRLAAALYRKGHGHPLHLRYTLKAIQERNLAFTEEAVAALPGCPHEGITAYYRELWHAIPEPSRAIMHLLAATQFPWPSQGIIACLDPQHEQIARIRDALRQVVHLLVHDDLGLRPFHSSLFAFVTQLPEHQDYRNPYLSKALLWLQKEAPDYWRWAYTWKVEAALGNDAPLCQGPNRQWAVDALSARRPSRDIISLLHASMEGALHQGDLPRLVELGLLHDYGAEACDYHHAIRAQLLYAQLRLEDDPYFLAWLLADMDDLTDGELVLIAEHALTQGDIEVFNRCGDTVAARLQHDRQHLAAGSYPSWQQRHTPQLALAAMSNDVQLVPHLLKFAAANRRHGMAREILSLYCEHLRAQYSIDHLRALLAFPVMDEPEAQAQGQGTALTLEEAMVLRRHTAFHALEEDLEIDELPSAGSEQDPFAALYAAVRQPPNYQPGVIHLPDRTLLGLPWHAAYERRFALRELFYQAFFGFLANHLYGLGERNGAWLQGIRSRTWAMRFVQELNACAALAAAGIQASAPMTFGAFFAQLSHVVAPVLQGDERFEEGNRTALEYYTAAGDAALEIGLDLLILAGASGGIPVITQDDLRQALSSPYCDVDTFLQRTLSRRRTNLEDAAAQWLLADQKTCMETTIDHCPKRAERFAQLSALAVLHGRMEEARYCSALCAEHLLAHGEHKDMLFYNVLGAVERYAEEASSTTARTVIWPWLAQLAPAIAAVLGYTDGDETRSHPEDLADALALAAPEKLPTYYDWQCERGDHHQALSTLHAFLERTDLSEALAQSLVMTAVDQVSLGIIARRAAEGDAGAQTVRARQQAYLGAAVFAPPSPHRDQNPPYENHTAPFDPARYPPAEFDLSLRESSGYLDRQHIAAWTEYWVSNGSKSEVYRVLADADERGIDIRCYDQLFALALALYGKARAYPWLVKAHIMGSGWSWRISEQNEAEQRWQLIKRHYPDRWQAFLQQTLVQAPTWLTASFSQGEFRRLIEYCLLMGQRDLAQRLVDQMVKRSLELVSMLPLPTPEWVNAS
jgi:hypothetical protein